MESGVSVKPLAQMISVAARKFARFAAYGQFEAIGEQRLEHLAHAVDARHAFQRSGIGGGLDIVVFPADPVRATDQARSLERQIVCHCDDDMQRQIAHFESSGQELRRNTAVVRLARFYGSGRECWGRLARGRGGEHKTGEDCSLEHGLH